MTNDKINLNDINYAIYKIAEWKNNYKVNQIGTSNEIPVSKNTYEHVLMSMDQIRKSEFEIDGEIVNGFIAIAYQTNPEINKMPVKEVVKLEDEEFIKIKEELDNLEFLNDDDSIDLDGEDYLIYKLEEECHIRKSIPANEFTMEYHINELKKLEEKLKKV